MLRVFRSVSGLRNDFLIRKWRKSFRCSAKIMQLFFVFSILCSVKKWLCESQSPALSLNSWLRFQNYIVFPKPQKAHTIRWCCELNHLLVDFTVTVFVERLLPVILEFFTSATRQLFMITWQTRDAYTNCDAICMTSQVCRESHIVRCLTFVWYHEFVSSQICRTSQVVGHLSVVRHHKFVRGYKLLLSATVDFSFHRKQKSFPFRNACLIEQVISYSPY